MSSDSSSSSDSSCEDEGLTVSAMACMEPQPDFNLVPFEYKAMPLAEDAVTIKIHACGVCASDLHQCKNDWGVGTYPMVPGHEIIGEVVEVGSAVTSLAVGQRVGVGPMVGSCRDCRECNRGEPMLCAKKIKAYGTPTGSDVQPHTYGGYATHVRAPADWTFPIPDACPTEETAPLLCAGITTWTPFVHYTKPGERVAILGCGGLGHVGLQFAAKMGHYEEVAVISRSANKEAEARELGATVFINSSDAAQMAQFANHFDFILSTISGDVEWGPYLDLLRPDGKLCSVGLPPKPISLPMMKIVTKRLSFCGSYLATPDQIRTMLQFCADKEVRAKIETVPMSEVNAAMRKVEENTVRYRMVLRMPDAPDA